MSRTAIRWLEVAAPTARVAGAAAIRARRAPAPSMYRKAICLPSCDQRGRAAYPFKSVIFFAPEPLAFTIQSWRCAFSPGLENNASVFESGDHVRSKSVLSPVVGSLTSLAGAFPEVSRIY